MDKTYLRLTSKLLLAAYISLDENVSRLLVPPPPLLRVHSFGRSVQNIVYLSAVLRLPTALLHLFSLSLLTPCDVAAVAVVHHV